MEKRKSCHCIKLRRAANAVTQLYDTVFSDLGLTTAQFSLLYSLKEIQPCSMRELADYMVLERSTLVRNVKVMSERRLVIDKKETGVRDSRLYLSDKGNDLLAKAVPKWNDIQECFERKLGNSGVKTLEQLLEQIMEMNQ